MWAQRKTRDDCRSRMPRPSPEFRCCPFHTAMHSLCLQRWGGRLLRPNGVAPCPSPIVGPGPAKVHLRVISSWDIKPIYDVIARIPGSTDPDEGIIRGNHHDAWVNGSEDPVSGLTPMLEEARAFGELLRQGWKPKRTVIY